MNHKMKFICSIINMLTGGTMKILEEPLLLNDLKETLNLLDEDDELLVKRSQKEPAVILSLEKYNKLKAEIYRAKKKE